jgi:metalloprotease
MIRALLLLLLAPLLIACENTNLSLLTEATSDAVTAVTLDDADVRRITRLAIADVDSKHQIAPAGNRYEARLRRLASPFVQRDGRTFDFKVYLTREINAFAMADGSIRVFSGLMDLMNDQELLFVIGHEMGHVVHDHTRRKVVMAYATSAVKKGLASQDNQVGMIASSMIGAFAEQLVNAQFSQHEERQADRYGAAFLKAAGYDLGPAVSALEKLADLARQHTFLSSHPNPDTRAKKLLTGDDNDAEGDESWIDKAFGLIKHIIVGLFNIVIALVKWLLSLL